jgi:CDP-diacylglycerol--glycerol-3-phosphate 3-phosphatidyltransferase
VSRTIHIHAEPEHWQLTWPIGLTMLRLLLLPVFLYVLLLDTNGPHTHRWWAIAIFALMAATDKLDGWLARRLDQTSKLGALLDPIADKLLVASSVVLLHFDWVAGARYTIPFWVVTTIYARDLIVAIGALALLAVIGKVSIQARLAGKLGTVLQLALVLLTLVGPLLDASNDRWVLPSLQFLWWAVATIALISCSDYLRQGVMEFIRSGRAAAA